MVLRRVCHALRKVCHALRRVSFAVVGRRRVGLTLWRVCYALRRVGLTLLRVRLALSHDRGVLAEGRAALNPFFRVGMNPCGTMIADGFLLTVGRARNC